MTLRLCAVLGILVVSACTGSDEVPAEGQQLATVAGPERMTRAFVWEPKMTGGLGAIVSQPYQVWLENTKVQQKKMMLEAERSDGLRLRWLNATTLEICYSKSLIYDFLNKHTFATEHSRESFNVEVVLRRVDVLDTC